MRQTLTILTVFGLLLSCNSSDATKISSDTTSVNQLLNTAASKTERQLVIEELKRLKGVFAFKDKEIIADIFQFPLSDTTVGIYIDDSTFNALYQKNGNKTTRAMFIRFFPQISESLQVDGLNQLFKNIKLDSLIHKDTLKHEAIIKTQPCYNFYSIRIEKNFLTLTVGMNSNKDYKSKILSKDEIPENSSEICEHVVWWLFKFDGKRLQFKGISGAG